MKLKITKLVATRLIQDRIDGAQSIADGVETPGNNFSVELKKFRRRLEKWRSFNHDLLLQIYSEESVAKQYSQCTEGSLALGITGTLEEYESLQEDIQEEVSFLDRDS